MKNKRTMGIGPACRKRAKLYCKDPIEMIENYEQAVNDTTQAWSIHHRRGIDEKKSIHELLEEDLYHKVPASDLIFLPLSTHISLHAKGRDHRGEKNPNWGKTRSEESRRKTSASMIGKNIGKTRTEEQRLHLSKVLTGINKGKHWYNNGQIEVFQKCCPSGFVPGKLKYKK